MPSKPRTIEANVVYHIFNRRTDRQCLFPSAGDFDKFLLLMEEGRRRYEVRHCGYCLMDTHYHLALWAHDSTSLGRYLRWLGTTHAIRFRIASGTRGQGHVYQDRYKSRPVRNVLQYFTLIRYIEANPLGPGLVKRAEHWRWSSLSERVSGRTRIIEDGPWELPHDWATIVNNAGPVLWYPLQPMPSSLPPQFEGKARSPLIDS